MSTQLDIELVPEVLSIVVEDGKTVTLIESVTSFSPIGAQTITTKQQTLKVTPPDTASLKYIPGDTVETTDMGVFVPALGLTVTIQKNLRVLIDSVVWTVVFWSPVYSGEDIALYGLRLRK